MSQLMVTSEGGIYLIGVDKIPALTSSGLQLVDDAGNLGVFVEDGGQVGIGTGTPTCALQIGDTGTSVTTHAYTKLMINSDSHSAIQFACSSGGNKDQWILFSDLDNDVGGIGYSHNGDLFTYRVAGNTRYIFRAETFQVNESGTNTKMSSGITINQQAYDNEILAFKSSDVSHAATDLAEADTYGLFQKWSGPAGGLFLRGFHDTSYPAVVIQGISVTDDTSKDTGALATIVLSSGKLSGNSIGSQGADGNLVVMRNNESTRWILDEDGDTWQSGHVRSVQAAATLQSQFIGTNNESGCIALLSYAADSCAITFDSRCEGGWYAEDTSAFAIYKSGDLLRIQRGTGLAADDTHSWTESISFLSTKSVMNVFDTTVNAQMTVGITINQAGNDDEILAFKSSDVGHGYTSVAETDTYGFFAKASGTKGGLKIVGVAEDTDTTRTMAFQARGGTATTTVGANAVGLVDFYIDEHDGANAAANITDSGIILTVRARVGGSYVCRWHLDEDGDSWQSGGASFYGDVSVNEADLYVTGAEGGNAEIYLYSDQGDDDADKWRVMAGADNWFKVQSYASGAYAAKLKVSTGGVVYASDYFMVNESGNAGQTQGITINQGANDDEILAFKSSDIAHGITGDAETDTYGFFQKQDNTNGGMKIRGLAVATGIHLHATCDNADTTKSSAGTAPVMISASGVSAAASAAQGENENILALRTHTTTVWIADEDGDTWQNGLASVGSLVFNDGGSTVDIIRDEDDMSSDDENALATQQSIKAFVEAQAGGAPAWTYDSQIATTSGTAVTLTTAIPDTCLEIEIIFNGVSPSGTDDLWLQIGDSGGIEDTGYKSCAVRDSGDGGGGQQSNSAFVITGDELVAAGDQIYGVFRLTRWDASEHNWIGWGITHDGVAATCFFAAGVKVLSAALTTIRLKWESGTVTFDAGEARVRYK